MTNKLAQEFEKIVHDLDARISGHGNLPRLILTGPFDDFAFRYRHKILAALRSPSPTHNEDAIIRCDACDNGVEQDWTFCPWCGVCRVDDMNEGPATPGLIRYVVEDDRIWMWFVWKREEAA